MQHNKTITTVVGVNKPEFVSPTIGDIFNTQWGHAILAQTGSGLWALITLEDGNRHTEGVQVTFPDKNVGTKPRIMEEDWNKIIADTKNVTPFIGTITITCT